MRGTAETGGMNCFGPYQENAPLQSAFQLFRKSIAAWRVGRAPTADMWSRPGTIAAEPWGNMAASGPEAPATVSWSPHTTSIGNLNICKVVRGKGGDIARMQAASASLSLPA